MGRLPVSCATQPISCHHSLHATMFDSVEGGGVKFAILASPLVINPVIALADSTSDMSMASRSSNRLSSIQEQSSCSVDGNISSTQHPARRFAALDRMPSAASTDPRTGRHEMASNWANLALNRWTSAPGSSLRSVGNGTSSLWSDPLRPPPPPLRIEPSS